MELVRIVVANATRAEGLAARTADMMRGSGYVNIAVTTANVRRLTTMVYFGSGREGEARRLASQVVVPETEVQPRPDGPLTVGNEDGRLTRLPWNFVAAS